MGIVNLLCDPSDSAYFFKVLRVGNFIRLDAKHCKTIFWKNFPSWNEELCTNTEEKYEIPVILDVI